MKNTFFKTFLAITLTATSVFASTDLIDGQNNALEIAHAQKSLVPVSELAIEDFVAIPGPKDGAMVVYDADFAKQQLENQKQTWAEYFADTAKTATKFVGNKALDAGIEAAKYIAAWNLNYYGLSALEELTAYGMYGVTSVIAGPAVGNGAYYATKGTIKLARYIIPGFEGALAAAYIPMTKAAINVAIDHGPTVAGAAYSVTKSASTYAYNKVSSLYNYYFAG